jgi:transcriptional regulator with XRE-family HTH domain
MSQRSQAIDVVPAAAMAALHRVGADLATARKRRRESLRSWAQRMNVSVPTLMRLEKGDASVSMGIYATALWLINRHEALASVAAPHTDQAALEAEIRTAEHRHRARGVRHE